MRRSPSWRRGSAAAAGFLLVAAPAPAADPPEAQPPPVSLELYVMSHCPWGLEAERAIIPAVTLLRPWARFRLRFIAEEVRPAGPGSPRFASFHGPEELAEDLRQLCVQRHAPDRLLEYLAIRNADLRASDWRSAAARLGIEAERIERCARGPEGERLLAADLRAGRPAYATASPTVVIGGRRYDGPLGPRAVALALCEAAGARRARAPAGCAAAEQLPPDPPSVMKTCGAGADRAPAAGTASGCGEDAAGGCQAEVPETPGGSGSHGADEGP
jgi:hypothetical protein